MARFPSRRTQTVRYSLPILLLSSAAWAQDARLPTITVGGTMVDDPAGLQLTLPTETGSRLHLTPMETPASVEVLSTETARDRGAQTIQDAVIRSTGMTSMAQPGNGGTALVARGFAGHNAVMQLYDGTRLYVASGTVSFPMDPWQADRIEILRGPASVMYGEGAIGGALNVVPRRPTAGFRNEAQVEFGTDMTRRVAAASSGPLTGKVSYMLSTNLSESDGYVDRGENSSQAFSGAVRVDATDHLAFTLSHDQAYRKPMEYWGTPLRAGQLDESLVGKNYNVRDAQIEFDDRWTQLKTEWQVTDDMNLRSVVYLLESNRRWTNLENYILNASTNLVTRSSFFEVFHDQEQYGTRNDLTIENTLFGLKNQTVVGFDANHIQFGNASNSGATGTSVVDPYNFDPGNFFTSRPTVPRQEARIVQKSVFMEDRLVLDDQWSVVGGLRHDWIGFTRDDFVTNTRAEKGFGDLSWRSGVVYAVTPSTSLYAQYATATSPVSSALLGQSAAQAALELSTAKQYEAGIKQSFMEGRGEWTFAGYQIVKNKLQTVNPLNTTIVEQVGQQTAKGVEATVAFDLVKDLRLEANGALLDSRYDDFVTTGGANYAGRRPAQVPEQMANLWVTWGFAPSWKAQGGLRYVGNTYSNDANTLKRPEYTVTDIGVSWSPVERLTVAFRIMNLFDEVYPVSSYNGGTQWVLGAPRTAYLTTSVKF